MRTKKDRVFSVVTTNPFTAETMTEPQLLTWLELNEHVDVLIFEGTQFRPNKQITLEPVDAPAQQPVDKPKRKYTKRAKPELPVNGAAPGAKNDRVASV